MNLHYKDYGPKVPGAPAVLLLHGFNGSVFNWYCFASYFAYLLCCRMLWYLRQNVRHAMGAWQDHFGKRAR